MNDESIITNADSMKCAISGNPFTSNSDIVVTPSGHLCEKRLLLSKLTDNGGIDPFNSTTSISLEEKDLISLNKTSSFSVAAAPRPTNANSLPNLLSLIQNETDQLMLELFDTRQALEETRRELSQSLYQNDAAIRVIARLTMERDYARQQLEELSAKVPAAAASGTAVVVEDEANNTNKKRKLSSQDEETESDSTKIPESAMKIMIDTFQKLSSERKKKIPPPETHATKDWFKEISTGGFVEIDKQSLHSSGGEKQGINCVCVMGDYIVTGGKDKSVVVYDKQKKVQVTQLSDNSTKGVISIIKPFQGDFVLSCASLDSKIRIYSISQQKLVSTLEIENDIPISLDIHPSQKYLVVVKQKGGLLFCDLSSSPSQDKYELNILASLTSPSPLPEGVHYTCTSLHPDGLILAVGRSDCVIELWDFKSQSIAMTIDNKKSTDFKIQSLCFSNNGYHLAVSTASSSNEDALKAAAPAYVLDVRKPITDKKHQICSVGSGVGKIVNQIQFDPYGKFLAFAGQEGIQIVPVKEWEKNGVLVDVKFTHNSSGGDGGGGGGEVIQFAWGENAKWITSVSSQDRFTRCWGVKDDDSVKMEE